MRLTAGVAVLVIGLSGCIFQNLSPTRRLTDQVYALNDETRWGRVDLASQRVAPEYRVAFLQTHRSWGRDIQIADTDLTNVVMAPDSDSATSLIAVSWYDQRTMTLHGSVLEQQWKRLEDHYVLETERVIDGDESLLTPPETEEDDDRVAVAP